MKDKIKYYLEKTLTHSRFEHSIRVAQTAEKLAKHYKLTNVEDFYLAGLIHDIAKPYKPKDFKKFNIDLPKNIDDLYNDFPKIWHAFSGPFLIQHEFGITNKELLNAVQWHSTGTENMDVMSQIIFISDFIEPDRKFPERKIAEVYAYENLDFATFVVSLASINYLQKKGYTVFPETVKCLSFYKKTIDKKRLQDIIFEIENI